MFTRLKNAFKRARTVLRTYLYARQNSGQIQDAAEELQQCSNCDLAADRPHICTEHEDAFNDVKDGFFGTHE